MAHSILWRTCFVVNGSFFSGALTVAIVLKILLRVVFGTSFKPEFSKIALLVLPGFLKTSRLIFLISRASTDFNLPVSARSLREEGSFKKRWIVLVWRPKILAISAQEVFLAVSLMMVCFSYSERSLARPILNFMIID